VLGGQRVWQTLDRGANWTHIGRVLSPMGGTGGGPAMITAIAIAPSQRDTICAATEDGRFFATFDGGSNWLERDQGLPLGPANVTVNIVIDPAHPNRVFIQTSGLAAQGRVWMTNDGGSSWSRLDAGVPTRRFFILRLGDELVAVWARLAAHHGHGVSNPAQGRDSGSGHLRPWGLSDPAPDSPPVAQPHAFVVAAGPAAGGIRRQSSLLTLFYRRGRDRKSVV